MADDGMERIIARIQKDSQRKITSMDKVAKDKEEEMRKNASTALDARIAALEGEHRKELEKERNRLLSEARLSARRKVLSAKEELLEEIEDQVFDELSVSGSEGYKKYLIKYLTTAKEMIGTGGLVKCRRRAPWT